jgi:hypothetical protein
VFLQEHFFAFAYSSALSLHAFCFDPPCLASAEIVTTAEPG